MDRLMQSGLIDTFRHFYSGMPHQYTWWPLGRERMAGRRLDYIFASAGIIGQVSDAFILREVKYSDHCPVGIYLVSDDVADLGTDAHHYLSQPARGEDESGQPPLL